MLSVLLLFGAVGAQTASAAGTVDIFVGYADNLRANPANFPTPWAGDPGVVFQGANCAVTPNCSYDAGAVRIVNNTSIPQTVDSVVVRIDTCVFDLWAPATLNPGQQLIVTQQTANPIGGCRTDGSFDTSDVGTNSTQQSTCDPDGLIPQVDVTLNGVTTTYADTGQVLNTDGVDRAVCPFGANESTQWTPIGSQQCPGATLTLAPPSQTHTLGETATLKATLANSCGNPLQGAKITFADFSGPNAGLTGTGVTDTSGVATFSYTSSRTGTDGWLAFANNPAGAIASNSAFVTWVLPIVYTGRAYAASLQLGKGNPLLISDTRNISTTGSSNTFRSVLTLPGPPVSLSLLSARVVTGSGKSSAAATIASAAVALPGAPVIRAVAVGSQSTSTCKGASGGTTLASLTIGGKGIDVSNIKPNTTITLGPLAKIVLNEQTPVPGASHGLTVNAIHITALGIADVVLASSRSDIHNCPSEIIGKG